MSLSLLGNISDPPPRKKLDKVAGESEVWASVLRLQPDSIEKKKHPLIFPHYMLFMDERQVGELEFGGALWQPLPSVSLYLYLSLILRCVFSPLREEMVKSHCQPAVGCSHTLRGHGQGSGPPTYTAHPS